MPDRDAEVPPHARLITALIWAGVGLAPIAALTALLGGGTGSIRVAVLLVAASVVLIGAALLLRNDPVLLRMDTEDQVGALREEITANARATGQRVQALQDEMTRLRAAGSPATALGAAIPAVAAPRPGAAYPAAGRAGVAMVEPGPVAGRAGVATVEPGPVGRVGVAAVFPGPVPGGRADEPGPVTGGRAGVAPVEPGRVTGGRVGPGLAGAGMAAAESGPVTGGRVGPGMAGAGLGESEPWPDPEHEPASIPPGRPAVAAASVAPPAGHTSVARIAAVPAPAVASAPVPPPVFGGAAAAGRIAGAASVAPRQRGAAEVQPYGARAVNEYGPGLSGSAWAERSEAVEPVSYGAAAPADKRPARRHAAPDTGTDIARYGLDSSDLPPYAAQDPHAYGAHSAAGEEIYGETTYGDETYGAADEAVYGPADQVYGAQAYGADHNLRDGYQGGYDQTGDAAWSGAYSDAYADPAPRDKPGSAGFGSAASSFFPEEDEDSPDPLTAHHGWAPRSQEHPGRW